MNKLADQKSPYLLQHANNPVEWYPWGDEAFNKARELDKPIFLSIGYSTCHWCHVMSHESFEDPSVAKLMNETFISIKVDREERPDIDKVYMTVCQVLTGSGGWPLTIFMTPDKKPFLAGTYFPKESRFGRIGLIDLIKKIQNLWENERDELLKGTQQIINAVQEVADEQPGNKLDKKTLNIAYDQLSMRFDDKYGGFGKAPKFPSPHQLSFLLRFWIRSNDTHALEMVEKTLNKMRMGGIFDKIGFGFHRYSTDQEWLVPHFEKMLYDQALLAIAYLEAYQATNKELYAETAREIFTYVLRDMTSPEGGFYSAEDADSEGVEGKFYVWERNDLYEILNEEDAQIIEKVYNIGKGGNYLEEATRKSTGKNILYREKSLSKLAPDFDMTYDELKMRIEQIRQRLFEYREKKIHPGKDDKILTDWNGLMIAALAKGARILNEKKYSDAAIKATEFILENLQHSEGTLFHRYREGEAGIEGYLDDYAFFIWGLIELYEATFNPKYIKLALDLNQKQIEHYWDDNIGAFYFTSDQSEELLVRQKEIYDGAIPSGNSVSMLNLLRLSFFTGDTELEKKAEYIGMVFAELIRKNPVGFTHLMNALDFAIGPSYTLVIAGNKEMKETVKILKEVNRHFFPNKTFIFRPADEFNPKIDELSDYIRYFDKINDKPTGYVCVDKTCKTPTNDIEELLNFMDPRWK